VRDGLHRANVVPIHVEDQKQGAADRYIMQKLDKLPFKPPGTVVLISGDCDFIRKLSDLRHSQGYHLIVISNKQAQPELMATANQCYEWRSFLSNIAPPMSTRKNTRKGHAKATTPKFGNTPVPKSNPKARKQKTNANNNKKKDKSKLHVCEACNTGFGSLIALIQHRDSKYHWKCREPTCGKLFADKLFRNQHEEATDHIRFQCSTCGKQFITDEDRENHRNSLQHWQCTVCKKDFTAGHSLENHQESTGHWDSDEDLTDSDSDSDSASDSDDDAYDNEEIVYHN